MKNFRNRLSLQYGAKQPDQRFFEFFEERSVSPVGRVDSRALFHIADKDFSHFFVELAAIDECVAFEVVFETAEVEVGRAGGEKFVVDDDGLGVEHPRFVEVDFYPGAQTVGNVGA